MMLLLQIVGAIILSVVLLVVLGFLFIRHKLRKFLAAGNGTSLPLEIHLNEDLAPDWSEEPKAKALVAALESLGFRTGRSYTIHEMGGVSLLSLFDSPYAAVVYKHPQAGHWVDIVFHAEDGTEITASNAPSGGEISHRPDQRKLFMTGASPEELVDAARREAGGRRGVSIDDVNFRDMFEAAYKRDMGWRNSQGGVSIEEFGKIAANMKENFSEQTLWEAFLQTKLQELHQWHAGCLAEFRKSRGHSWQSDDEQHDDDLFIVPAKTDPRAFVHYLADCGIVEDERKESLAKAFPNNQDIRALFQRINESYHEDLRATLVGQTEYPVVAEIYR